MRNVEIKARYRRTQQTDETLTEIGARLDKIETQTDTYFNVDNGRLKIRERDTGQAQLIQYFREDKKSPRPSYYEIVHLKDVEKVKETLTKEHGVRVIVKKKREIWIWDNVRIHFDIVENLGDFIEFEAVLEDEHEISGEQQKVEWLMKAFGIQRRNLVWLSYGDMV